MVKSSQDAKIHFAVNIFGKQRRTDICGEKLSVCVCLGVELIALIFMSLCCVTSAIPGLIPLFRGRLSTKIRSELPLCDGNSSCNATLALPIFCICQTSCPPVVHARYQAVWAHPIAGSQRSHPLARYVSCRQR